MNRKKMIKLYLILLSISALSIFIRPLSALGQSIFIALVTMIFTYYFTKHVFEGPKIKRWNSIKEKVTSELNEEFSGILSDIAMICHFNNYKF